MVLPLDFFDLQTSKQLSVKLENHTVYLWTQLVAQRCEQQNSTSCASVIPVKSPLLLDHSHCSLAACRISCLPFRPLISSPSKPRQTSPRIEIRNGSRVGTSQKLWVKMHIACHEMLIPKKMLLSFSFLFLTFDSKMSYHYSANANLIRWMWREKSHKYTVIERN